MNRIYFAVGFLTAAIGTIPFLVVLGVLPAGRPSPDNDPAWLAFVAGLVFIFGGIAAMIRSFAAADGTSGDLAAGAPRILRILYRGLGIAIAGSLATLFSWVAFGPGARHFTVSAGGYAGPAGPGGDVAGRVLFGAVALLGWFITGAMILNALRRWFPRSQEQYGKRIC